MKPLRPGEIRGVWGTLLLPINEDESIDYARLGTQIDRMIAAGVEGIYTNGTAGEFHTQSEDEFDRVSQTTAERCEKSAVPFQIGVSHTSAQTSLERLKRAKALAPSAFQVILPDWYPVADSDALAFLQRMAEVAAPIGLVLYNPPHAKRVLDPAALSRLARAVPSLVGVKVADGNASWYAAMRKHLPDVSLFVPGHHLATGFLLGANGSYSNVACLSPKGACKWYRLMTTDLQMALSIERKILQFFQDYIQPLMAQGFANPALDKLLAGVGGWADIGTRLRWPYQWIPQSEVDRLAPLARDAFPELF